MSELGSPYPPAEAINSPAFKTPPVEADPGDIKVMLNRLDDAITQAHKMAQVLEEKVQPILRPTSSPRDSEELQPKQEQSPLAMLIGDKAEHVRNLVDRLTDTVERIQL